MSRLASFPVSLPSSSTIPAKIDVEKLSSHFTAILEKPIAPSDLLPDAVWRDNLALTGGLRTFYGAEAVTTAWNETTSALKTQFFRHVPQFGREWRMPDGSSWVDIYYAFETAAQPRLVCTVGLSVTYIGPENGSDESTWKIWVIKSVLDQLKDAPSVDVLEPRDTPKEAADNEPSLDAQHIDCVIVGAGQAGLNTAARCEALGIDYVVIDQNKKVGDNWRLRYKSTKLHTIREYAHLPFDRTFGEEYPEFLTKDNLADGYAAWTAKFGIKMWFETTLETGVWNEKTEKWTLNLTRKDADGSKKAQSLNCSFVIMCVGAGGQVPVLPQLPGKELFKGQVLHSAEYTSPEAFKGMRGIVIGSANTAHDVAEDMVEAELASTTMVQRNPTFVLPVEWYTASQNKIYSDKIPTAVSDKISFISPHAVQRLVSQTMIHDLVRKNQERFDSLEKAGFRVDRFGDPHWHLIERLGGHYMDVGASAKISKGIIKVKSGPSLTHYTATGLGFSDGTELPADLIVFATGFDLNTQGRIREIFGDAVADKVGPFSHVNDEGELEGAWKFNHPGLACNGGAIGPSRWYSRFIALHMKAKLMGTPLVQYRHT